MEIIDISLPLSLEIPYWPGSLGFQLLWSKRLDKRDSCNNSQIICDTHAGTHLDAPLHYIKDGAAVDQLPLDVLTGQCRTVHLPGIKEIGPEVLSDLKLPDNTTRLLLRTDNSRLWSGGGIDFKENFVALNADAARWIVEKEIRLIGIDYLSIGSYHGGVKIHQILLNAGLIILEGLNLSDVVDGEYELICLPLKIVGAEGSPARAILRKPN